MSVYRCVVIDPPWPEHGGGKIKRGADRHYALMSTDAIRVLLEHTIEPKIAEDAHLWLWVTNNYLQSGLLLMSALRFRYVNNLVWVKPTRGLGQYLRGQHELCLFGVRGKTMLPADRTRSTVVHWAKGRHSAKPDGAFETFEAVSPGPRLEVFARAPREGWDVWGNEADGGA